MTALKNVLFTQIVTFQMPHIGDRDNYRYHDNFACNNRNMQYT